MKKSFLIVVLCILFPFIAFAQENMGFNEEAEISYVETSGNTEIRNFSLKNLLTYVPNKKFKTSWEARALYSTNNGNQTAESYFSELRADYFISGSLYSAFMLGWKQDKFSGIENNYYLGPTLGYEILTGPKHYLKSEAGADYNYEEYTDGTEDEYMRGKASAKYEYQLTEKTSFRQSAKYMHSFSDSENYNFSSETAVKTSITDILSMKTSYELKYDNQPVPSDLEKTDTILSVTLVVSLN